MKILPSTNHEPMGKCTWQVSAGMSRRKHTSTSIECFEKNMDNASPEWYSCWLDRAEAGAGQRKRRARGGATHRTTRKHPAYHDRSGEKVDVARCSVAEMLTHLDAKITFKDT